MANKIDIIRETLRAVVDPELHLNIVDLGLVYEIAEPSEGHIEITMTLTTPGCPVGSAMMQAVRRVVQSLPDVREATVNLTFDPRWSTEMISEVGRRHLNMF